MQLKLYTVRDIKTGIFEVPLAQHTHGEAERTFTQMSKNPKSLIHEHPQDYDLYYIGDYDNLSAKFSALESPQLILNGAGLKPALNS